MNITILEFDALGSTNETAIDHARRGAEEGLCVIAREQTFGRGRLGRSWYSRPGSGLYFSIVLRPKIETRFYPLITLAASVAVCETLGDLYQMKADIKWPNDVLISDRKICGILAETAETIAGTAVVVGIGLNYDSAEFPEEISAAATSVLNETGKYPEPGQVHKSLTRFLVYYYLMLSEPDGHTRLTAEWVQRSSYASGKPVRVRMHDQIIEGTTSGLEENGALRILTTDGELRIIQAGEIESLRAEE